MMRQNIYITIAMSCTAAIALVAPAEAGLPGKAAPSGFHSVEDASGGRIVTGPLSAATSPTTAFQSGLHCLHGYFDGAPDILSAVRTREGGTLALFRATLRGTAVTGLAITTFDAKNGAGAAMIFDTTARFPKTIKPLMAHLQNLKPQVADRISGGTQSAGKPVPPLQSHPFADGTGSVSLPGDWQAQRLQSGSVIASGPDGAKVLIGVPITALDPRKGLGHQLLTMGGNPPGLFVPYVTDPKQAFLDLSAAMARKSGGESYTQIENSTVVKSGSQVIVSGTDRNGGVKTRFSALLTLSPQDPQGGWLIGLRMIVAPESSYYDDLPLLNAIVNSYRYNNAVMVKQTNDWIAENARQTREIMASRQAAGIAQIQETGRHSIENARRVQDSIDRSAAGFTHYINDTNVVQYIPSGAHGTTSANMAQMLIQEDPQNFREVPVNEYRAGVDY